MSVNPSCVTPVFFLTFPVLGFFMGNTKAIINGCEDHWVLQDRSAMPVPFQMTVCVDVRVLVPGPWVAFSYGSVRAPHPDLALEGDSQAVYAWLLQVRHRFPLQMSPGFWHRVCLRRDALRNKFSLEVTLMLLDYWPYVKSLQSVLQIQIRLLMQKYSVANKFGIK